MNTKVSTVLVCFGIFWSAMTLLFDAFTFVPAARQVMAVNFPSTEGRILSSEVTEHNDSEGGTTHGVSIRYVYSVDGQEYTGTRYRYDNSSSSDSDWAYAVVEARPPETRVPVFYNPRDPQDSVLATGLLGSDLFMFTFMTPFNAAMLGFWWVGLARLRRMWFKPFAGGVKIITELKKTRVRLTTWSPLAITLATTGLMAFGSIFVIAPFYGGFHPQMKTMLVAWSVILCGAIGAGAWHTLMILFGKYDLIIDEMAGSLELPATQGRKSRRRIALGDVVAVYVQSIETSNDGEQSSSMYAPTLRLKGLTQPTERLAQWMDADKATQFMEWLREKLPLRPTTLAKDKS